MKRREFVQQLSVGALAGIAAAKATDVFAANASDAKGKISRSPKDSKTSKGEWITVLETSFDCMKKGEICLMACTNVLAQGSTSMADCQKSVMNMLAVVGGLAKVAAYQSIDERLLKNLASVCAEYCRDCEEACRPHIQHHVECKDCMEACIRCAKACETLVAA